jgi:hypothetical protein
LSFGRKEGVRKPIIAAAVLAALMAFFIVPRFFLETNLETIGPTDKLRFLRALKDSKYTRAGQREFRIEGQNLIMIWDLRWNTLPESSQKEIVRIVGRAWSVVGGAETEFRIEGEDGHVAMYKDSGVQLGSE